MSSVYIDPIVPGQAVLHKTQSTADYLNKNAFYYQVLPNGQGNDFKYSGNNRIEFQVSSNSDMWDLSETHLSFNYTTTLTEGNAARQVSMRDQTRWMEGGALNVIRNIQIATTAGVVIENIQGYNKLRHIISCCNESPEFVDRVKCKRHDSMNEVYDMGYNGSELRPAILNAAAADRIGAFQDDLGVVSEQWGIVPQPVEDDYQVVNVANGVAVGAGDGLDTPADVATSLLFINRRVKKSVRADSAQNARTAEQKVTLKLQSGFFENKNWFPLLLTKGIVITIELEQPEFCFTTGVNPQAANGMSVDYTIYRPKLFCRMITPTQSLVEQYVKAMKDNKLNYTFGTYDRVLYQNPAGSSGNISFQLPVSRRSISHTLTVVQNARKNALDRTTGNLNSYNYGHRYLRANMTSIQWQQGSDLYPISGPVEIDRYNARPMELLLTTFGKNGVEESMRFKPYEFQARNVDSGNANECHKLILGYRFSRDFSPFTGVDTSSGNFIQMNFVQSAAYQVNPGAGLANQPLYIYTYVGYDAIMSITNAGIIVRK